MAFRGILQFFGWGALLKNTIFIKMHGVSPQFAENIKTGRPHIIINNSVFKKSNVMSCQ